MPGYAWAQTAAHPARLASVLSAIVLGTLFLAATAVFAATSSAGLRIVAAAPLSAADVIVDRDPEAADPGAGWPEQVAEHPDVTATAPLHAGTVQLVTDEIRATANLYSISDRDELRWFELAEGEWPANAAEMVADAPTLDSAGLAVGDTVSLLVGDGETTDMTVVGAADIGFRPLTGVQYQFYTSEGFFAGESPLSVTADIADGTSPEAVVESMGADLPDDLHPMTAEEQSRLAADRFAGGAQQLELILLVFALIALLAAALVIANTFTILLSQRRRDTALLRLVGAERSQVRNLVLAEALIIGSIGSAIGVAAGVGAGYAGASLMELTGGGLHVGVPALAGAFLTGVATTVCAAWFPARKAAGTAPVEALRSAPLQNGVRFRSVHAVGLAAAATGAAVMVFGMLAENLPVSIAGGSVGAVGLLMALRYAISRLVGGADRLLRLRGGIAELAGANLRRNTGRAATATLTLVLGLGLIAALATAASTGRATIDGDLDDRFPVDVSARVDTGSVPAATVDMVRDIDDLVLVETPRTEQVTVEGLGETTLVGVSPELARAVGAEDLAADGTGAPAMLVSEDQLNALGAAQGETVDLSVDGEAHRFTLYASELATSSGAASPVVREEALDAVAPGDERGMVWGTAAAGADYDALAEQMSRVAGADPAITLSGALAERTGLTDVLDVLVNLSLAMLLVTMVISSLGVANTLSLSVLERTRELALLRALGLTRGGLRSTLAVEAAVIAVLGALLGLVIGIPYGLVGVNAVIGGTAPLVVAVPWAELALVLVSALVIAAAATVLPSRRAARIAPAEGLGAD
ncbi:FtsX-like permease family protein [Streptomonospora nanhaiensis]|uniref:FtsX-like permease family protein n=1 Tax=Streptomonospora nanhaiensis TaxID=1323731 RepID=A0ABY6YM72_9ACTN|nr:FtsX-like permease family protein [Streptomonospora nanhaiensis]WAE73390.1 FtsX-like permease family protein [Streptomonospora nanhaiensis]